MGWQDAPVIDAPPAKSKWMDAPEVAPDPTSSHDTQAMLQRLRDVQVTNDAASIRTAGQVWKDTITLAGSTGLPMDMAHKASAKPDEFLSDKDVQALIDKDHTAPKDFWLGQTRQPGVSVTLANGTKQALPDSTLYHAWVKNVVNGQTQYQELTAGTPDGIDNEYAQQFGDATGAHRISRNEFTAGIKSQAEAGAPTGFFSRTWRGIERGAMSEFAKFMDQPLYRDTPMTQKEQQSFAQYMESIEAASDKSFGTLPPATTLTDRAADVTSGLTLFAAKMLLAKKVLPSFGGTSRIAKLADDILTFEAVNLVDKQTGTGTAQAGIIHAADAIPLKGLPGFTIKAIVEGLGFGGLTKLEGGDNVQAATMALLPVGLRGVGGIRSYFADRLAKARTPADAQAAVNDAKSLNDPVAAKGVMDSIEQARTEANRTAQEAPGTTNAEKPTQETAKTEEAPKTPEDAAINEAVVASKLVGIKNSYTESRRAELGLPERTVDKITLEGVKADTDAAYAKNPDIGKQVEEDYRNNPRSIDDPLDSAILQRRATTLDNRLTSLADQMKTAAEADNPTAVAALKQQYDAVNAEYQANLDVTNKAGTLWGQTGVMRQQMMKSDYSFTKLQRDFTAANNGRAPTAEEIVDLKRKADELQQAKAEAESLRQQVADRDRWMEEMKAMELVTQEATKPTKSINPRVGRTPTVFTDEAAAAARQRLSEKLGGSTLRAGLDPTILVDLAQIAGNYLEKGIRNVAGKLVEEFGPKIKPHLDEIIATARAKLAPGDKDELVKKMSANVEAGKPITTQSVRKLAETIVAGGVHGREEIISAIHDTLKSIPGLENITREQARDMFSGRGQYKRLNPDAIKKEVRQAAGEALVAGNLQDLIEKQPPPKTGMEREAPTDEQRRLQQQVEAQKKLGGYVKTDPETQLRTYEDRIVAGLEHQIADLDAQIEKGERFKKDPGPVNDTPKVAELRARRDALRETLDEMLPREKTQLTPEQRQANIIKALDRSYEENLRQIEQADLAKKSPKTPDTPEIAAKRARNKALASAKRELKAGTASEVEKENLAYIAHLDEKGAALMERLASQDFEPKTNARPKKDHLTDAAFQAELKFKRLERQYQQGLNKARLANRGKVEKVLDFVSAWTRATVLSAPSVVEHLAGAALSKLAFSPIEEAVGAGIGKVLPETVVNRAARQGRASLQTEIHATAEGFLRIAKDVSDAVKHGQLDFSEVYGNHPNMPAGVLEFIGRLHGALKTTEMRAEFTRSWEKRMSSAASQGINIDDPRFQWEVGVAAEKDAMEAVMREDTRLNDAKNHALEALERPDPVTGKVSIPGKVIATAVRYALPVYRIGVNLVGQTLQYMFGFEMGLYKLGKAMRKGTENLTAEESDLIMKYLKKGSVGHALLALGFFNPNNVGGYYQHGKKRDENDVKVGGIRLFGINLPASLLRAPPLEVLQAGATLRRVWDASREKGQSATESAVNAAGVTAGGLLDQLPGTRSGTDIQRFEENPAKALEQQFLDRTIPRLISQPYEWATGKTLMGKEKK